MKKQVLILLLLITSVWLAGCAKEPVPNQAATTPASVANSNASTGQNSTANQNTSSQKQNEAPSSQALQTTESPQALLQGTYAISEVQHDGIVEMISSANTTEITFKAPSSFSRVSKKNGKRDYTDSGQYKIEGSDKLILRIIMSNEKIQINPVSKQHTFALSPTGDELKLTSSTGKTAVFRRISNN
jgi:hypothetical protein